MDLKAVTHPNCGSTGDNCSQSAQIRALPRRLLGRLYLLAAIVAVETVLVGGVLRLIEVKAVLHLHPAPFAIVSFAVFLGFGHSWLKAQRESLPFGFKFLGGHILCVAGAVCFRVLTALPGAGIPFSHASLFAADATLLLSVVPLALACVPLRTWIGAFRATSPLWIYAALTGALAVVLRDPLYSLWRAPATGPGHFLQMASFRSLRLVLGFFVPGLIADAATFTIGTPRFLVQVRAACSGIEGMGLILAFTSFWLWYFRKEIRFPQALVLIPCALGCIWLLNIGRLAALILIGDSVSPEVAMVGFHSLAGWIVFTAVALAFSIAMQRLSWVRKRSPVLCPAGYFPQGTAETRAGASVDLREQRGESPAIRAYLIPFLAILAASFVSRAASGSFEWLYPLRFVAAAIAIWRFWPELKKLDWRIGWIAPATGVAVFLVWVAPSWWAHQPSASPIGPALAALSLLARVVWIAFRVAAAAITVPIAEELAFRGYLARRVVDREFDRVSFSRLSIVPVVVSSAAFGLMHGQHWMVGTVAGLAYAFALRWRGRMGDAVAAHAISNLLLAAWVLGCGDWAQW
jgi:exosortase E/protease (VPEID-CTERM system)